VAVAVVLDHEDVEHARQRQVGGGRQGDQADPAATIAVPHGDGRGGDAPEGPFDPPAQRPDDEHAHGDQGAELDHRLDGDGHDDAMVALGRVEVAGAEEDGEDREAHGRDERHEVRVGRDLAPFELAREGAEGERHGLELERDVGRDPRHRDHRDKGADPVRLSEARGDEVGDGRDALRPAHMHELAQEPPPADHDEARTQVDREVLEARARRVAHRAVEGPGGAVDRQGQGVDEGRAQPAAPLPAGVRPRRPRRRGWRRSPATRDEGVEGQVHGSSPSSRDGGRASAAAATMSRTQAPKR
jgi:hypothetical protein